MPTPAGQSKPASIFLSVCGENQGPFSIRDIEGMVEEGKASAETHAWTEGREGWCALKLLCPNLFSKIIPPASVKRVPKAAANLRLVHSDKKIVADPPEIETKPASDETEEEGRNIVISLPTLPSIGLRSIRAKSLVLVLASMIVFMFFFHIVIHGNEVTVIAKESPSFARSVVEVSTIIKDYNSAPFLVKIEMRRSYLIQKLMKEGILRSISN